MKNFFEKIYATMKSKNKFLILVLVGIGSISCVSNRQYLAMQESLQSELSSAKTQYSENLSDYEARLSSCEQERKSLNTELGTTKGTLQLREEQINSLRDQLADAKAQRDKQQMRLGDLTALSQSANDNIQTALTQLEKKDKYIQGLQAAKTKTDSTNLALAVDLNRILQDTSKKEQDFEVGVEKTLVFIKLSDQLLFQNDKPELTSEADTVLKKIAEVIDSRPGLEIAVEGHTSHTPIETANRDDSLDSSLKKVTSVVRTLQKFIRTNPNRVTAAARSDYNALPPVSTVGDKTSNRPTRIVLRPKPHQFYDLLNPSNLPK